MTIRSQSEYSWRYSFTAARENKGFLISVVSFTLTQSSRVGAVGTVESVGEIRDAERVSLAAWEEGRSQLS